MFEAVITIRPASSGDASALARLAALDSADLVPPAPLLLADVDGQLRVALSLHDGGAIADPFYPTVELVSLLRARSLGSDTSTRGPRGWRARLKRRVPPTLWRTNEIPA
jgi:hypothetical protein